MTLHLIKLAVGVTDVAHLVRLQAERLHLAAAEPRAEGLPPQLRHRTRNTPKRTGELLDGGSIYWVIRGKIRVRQRLLGIERGKNAEGKPSCTLILDPPLVAVQPRKFRPFQGWRYLPGADAPRDLGPATEKNLALPNALADELSELGLI